jgi:hypothetical protein
MDIFLPVCFVLFLQIGISHADERDYCFDGKISREVLENYLDRSITIQGFLHDERTDPSITAAQHEDTIRMVRNIGAKFIGRAICAWGNEAVMVDQITRAEPLIKRIHEFDPEIILQGTLFECITTSVNDVPVPDWVFREFLLKSEPRNFNYNNMLYPDRNGVDRFGKGSSVPDMKQLETRMWFFFLSARYIDVGIEGIHFGQIRLMDDRDPDLVYWRDMLQRVRYYAARNARRHWILCDAHSPDGDSKVAADGILIFDFDSFIMRVNEVPLSPMSGELRMETPRSVYGRSPGGMTPSGWECEHIPYLIEIDNYGYSGHGGDIGVGGVWVWGYDEITWFANKNLDERNRWLRYIWNWIREHDTNGHFEMPGIRCLSSHTGGKSWYFANTSSAAVPEGFGQEDTIKQIWLDDK